MEKIFVLTLSVFILFSLVACGKNSTTSTSISGTVSQTEATDVQIGETNTSGTNSSAQVVADTDNSEATNITNTENIEQSSIGEQHIHTYTVAKYSPSCETDGFTKYSCNCGAQYTEDTIPATGHSYNNWVEKAVPTETSVGKEERKCKNCDKTEFREIPKLIPGHTHRYTSSVTKEATCKSEGVKTFSCSCGAKYTETIAVKPHNYNKTEIIQPTCTKQGYTTYTCSCGSSYTADYTSPSHSYVDYVCTVCGYSTIPQGYTAIYKSEHLNNLSLDGKYILMCDIDMKQVDWTPVGTESAPFTGTFDGNGYSIKNIRMAKNYISSGLFACSSGTIQNLGIENITIKNGAEEMGGLVAINNGTISNCFVTGSFSSTAHLLYVGGLVGINNGTISNCYASCDVSASASYNSSSFAGGLVGENRGKISNCYASGEVKASSAEYAAYAGGLVGKQDVVSNDATITNCFATGKVDVNAKKYAWAGGIVGWTNGSADNCWCAVDFKVKQGYTTNYEPTNIHGVETTLTTLKTTSFQKETLGWSSDVWNFAEGQFPTLKK